MVYVYSMSNEQNNTMTMDIISTRKIVGKFLRATFGKTESKWHPMNGQGVCYTSKGTYTISNVDRDKFYVESTTQEWEDFNKAFESFLNRNKINFEYFAGMHTIKM